MPASAKFVLEPVEPDEICWLAEVLGPGQGQGHGYGHFKHFKTHKGHSHTYVYECQPVRDIDPPSPL